MLCIKICRATRQKESHGYAETPEQDHFHKVKIRYDLLFDIRFYLLIALHPTFAPDMTNNKFEQIADVIRNRRSVGGGKMNGQIIPDEAVNQVLALADWAPTHGRTEPWRFFVYGGASLAQFGKIHAELYWNNTPEDKRQEATYEKLLHNIDKASHLVVAAMKRGANEKIPQVEEVAATSAAIQNILLGATAMGISSFWSTGGMAHKPAFKAYLDLGDDDIVMGFIFLGYTDEPAKEGVRNIPLSEKVKWL
jgi:nitroreductase